MEEAAKDKNIKYDAPSEDNERQVTRERSSSSHSMGNLSERSEEEENRIIKINRDNILVSKCLYCCTRRKAIYKNNRISTSKYNLITFFPKNLFL